MADIKRLSFKQTVIDENPPGTHNDVCLIFDVNGDGCNDVVIGGYKGENNVVWYEYPTWQRHLIGEASLEAGGAFFDINGNGRLDVVAGSMSTPGLFWWENPEDPTKPWTRRLIDDRFTGNYHDQVFADVDRDGAPELVTLTKRDDMGVYYDIPADPTVEPWPEDLRRVIYEDHKLEGLVVADVDGDGDIEIVVGPGYFKRPATEGDPWQRHEICPDWQMPRVRVADINGDGRVEIIMTEAESLPARLAWFEPPDWKMHLLRDNMCHGHSLEIADFNGDGTPDIFVGEMNLGKKETPQLIFFLNDGKGHFVEQSFDNPVGTHESKIGDIGNTGRPSVVVKPYSPHNRIVLWENQT